MNEIVATRSDRGAAAAPTAAIIIPHFNDARRLSTCLAALASQVTGAPVEVVVVDNGSETNPAPLVAPFSWVRLVHEPVRGAAAARNRGVAETRAPMLFFLDSDCVPAANWIATALALGPANRVIGGRIELFDETPPPRSGAEAFETVFAFRQERYIRRNGFSVTANLITSRAVFETTGPFVPGLSVDADWCWRATATGARLDYVPALCVRHPTRQDWPALRKKWRRLTDEAWGLTGRGTAARAAWAARAALVLASGIADLPKVFFHRDLTPAEIARGTGTLLRLRALRARWMIRQAITA